MVFGSNILHNISLKVKKKKKLLALLLERNGKKQPVFKPCGVIYLPVECNLTRLLIISSSRLSQ